VVFIVEFLLCFILYFATWLFLKTLWSLKTFYWKQQHLWTAYELNYEQIFQELKEQPRTGKQMEMIELYLRHCFCNFNVNFLFYFILFSVISWVCYRRILRICTMNVRRKRRKCRKQSRISKKQSVIGKTRYD